MKLFPTTLLQLPCLQHTQYSMTATMIDWTIETFLCKDEGSLCFNSYALSRSRISGFWLVAVDLNFY